MKILIKETQLTDNSTVFDINLFPNGFDKTHNTNKVIFSCISEQDAIEFFHGLQELIKKHTVENIEEAWI